VRPVLGSRPGAPVTRGRADASVHPGHGEPVVITRLFMGLGNQLFQYAAGRALALHHDVALKVDLTMFGGTGDGYSGAVPRRYELHRVFAIAPEIASAEEIAGYSFSQPVRKAWVRLWYRRGQLSFGLPYEGPRPIRVSSRVANAVRPFAHQRTYWEPHFRFDRRFFEAEVPVLLYGYWQSWRYLGPYRDQILDELAFAPEVIASAAAGAAAIGGDGSVALHMRLTDRLGPGYRAVPREYYRSAIRALRERHGDLRYFVFSDDPDAAVDLLPDDLEATVVSGALSPSAATDLYLLSSCQHVVVGNSSFSWWGAQLQRRDDRTVVAPTPWHNAGHTDARDLLPPEWIQLPI
jgi:hypothetical protein